MTFERHLSDEEILGALSKGSEKADSIKERAESNPGFLTAAHAGIVTIVDRSEEHFSLEGYQAKNSIYAKGKESLTEANIRGLFLCAVEAVQCLEELEPALQKIPDIDKEKLCGKDRHQKLLRAVTVFRTDGQSDIPAIDVEHIIQDYRHQQLNAA